MFITALATPNLNGIPISVPNNSLLQAKDGWLVIALAVAGLAFLGHAYRGRSIGPLWGTAIAGVAIIAVAIYDGTSLQVSYIIPLTGATGSVKAGAGVGIFLAGISGAIMAVGALLSRTSRL